MSKPKKPKPATMEISRTSTRARLTPPKNIEAFLLDWRGCYDLAAKLMRIGAELRIEEEKAKQNNG